MIDDNILEMFLAVRAYCMTKDDCSGCPLYNKDSETDCQNAPFLWYIKEEGEAE